MLKPLLTISGLQVATMIVLLLRTKVLAVLLGPDAVGLMAVIDKLVAVIVQTASLSLPFAALRFLPGLSSTDPPAFYRLLWRMTFAIALLAGLAQPPTLPAPDAARIAEFYRLADQVQDKIWPNWSKTPAPLLLVTTDTEFLTHFDSPPKDFQKLGDDLYARLRQFPPSMQATFPAVGLPAAIVIGEPIEPPGTELRGSRRAVRELTAQLHKELQAMFDAAQVRAGA